MFDDRAALSQSLVVLALPGHESRGYLKPARQYPLNLLSGSRPSPQAVPAMGSEGTRRRKGVRGNIRPNGLIGR